MDEISQDVLHEEGAVSAWPDFPWLTILIQPRKTIRSIVNSSQDRYVILLMLLTGLTSGISRASSNSTFESMPLPLILILIPTVGMIGGLLAWVIGAELLRWTGSWFGGGATSGEVRAAMAWSAVPYISSLILQLVMLLLYGFEIFSLESPRIEQNPFPFLITVFIMPVLSAWWYFLFWKCYAEVQGLSLMKALVALLVPGLVIFGIMMGCGALLIAMA